MTLILVKNGLMSYLSLYPVSLEGRIAIVTDARRDAVDAIGVRSPDARDALRLAGQSCAQWR
jgi:hypothetical protein